MSDSFLLIPLSSKAKISFTLAGLRLNFSLAYSLYAFLSASVIALSCVDPLKVKLSGNFPFDLALLYLLSIVRPLNLSACLGSG